MHEALEDGAQRGGCVLADLSVVLGVRRANVRVSIQDFEELVALDVAEDDVFWCSFRESLEIVADLKLHFLLLHQGQFQDAGADVFEPYAAHQEIVGHLACQGSVNGGNLHEAVHEERYDSPFPKHFIHEVRHSFILASGTREDRQGQQRDPIGLVIDVVAQCQQQLGLPEGGQCVSAEFERLLQHFNCVFEAEVGALANDSPHAELEHLGSAKADLGAAVDEPCPLLIIADLPLDPLQHLAAHCPVGHQVAEVQDGVRDVRVDHLHDGLKMFRSERFRRQADDLPEGLFLLEALHFVSRLLHEGGDLVLADLLAQLGQLA